MTGLPTITVKLDDGTGTFPTDISQYVSLSAGPLQIIRGRSDEQSEISPAVLTIVLENVDGRFTLGSTVIAAPSPIYIDQRIQVTFTVGAVVSKRITGYVQDWPVEWPDGSDTYAVATITAVDRGAALARRKLRSIVEQEIRPDGPVAYYPLGEPGGASTAGDISGRAAPAMGQAGSGTGVVFGTANGPGTDGLTAAQFAAGKYLTLPAPPTYDTVELFIVRNGVPAGGERVIVFTGAGTYNALPITWVSLIITASVGDEGELSFTAHDSPFGAIASNFFTSSPSVCDGSAHHAMAYWDAATHRMKLRLDGVEYTSGGLNFDFVPSGEVSFGGGVVGSMSNLTGSLAHIALHSGTPSLARTGEHSTAGRTGFAGETPNARITRYAGYGSVAAADLALETGVLPGVAHFECSGSSPQGGLQKVAEAEQGFVFIRGDGKLVFQNRHHRALKTTTTDWTITNNDIEPGARFSGDMQGVINTATTSRADGATQTAENAASIAKHEQYPGGADGLLVMTDDEAQQLANWLVGTHAEPGPRLPNVTIDLQSQIQTFQEAWLAREISDRLKVTGLPAQAPAATADLFIEGWTETLTKDTWEATLNTTPASFETAWILDDATYSVLGTTTRLHY